MKAKRIRLIVLAMMALAAPAFVEAVSPCFDTRVYRIENLVSLGETSYGNRIPLDPGDSREDGEIFGEIDEEFGLEASVTLSSEILESFALEAGMDANYKKRIVSGCSVKVPDGQTGYIWYQKTGNAYQADIVWYQGGTGLPLKEVSRSSAILYQPTTVHFTWDTV